MSKVTFHTGYALYYENHYNCNMHCEKTAIMRTDQNMVKSVKHDWETKKIF